MLMTRNVTYELEITGPTGRVTRFGKESKFNHDPYELFIAYGRTTYVNNLSIGCIFKMIRVVTVVEEEIENDFNFNAWEK
jgi:hypothetical protein